MFAVKEYPGAITYYTSSDKIPRERKTRMSASYISCNTNSAVFVKMGTSIPYPYKRKLNGREQNNWYVSVDLHVLTWDPLTTCQIIFQLGHSTAVI